MGISNIFKRKNVTHNLSQDEARRLCEIIKDSLSLCQRTTKPDVFFSRLNLAESECRKVVASGVKGTYGKAASNLLSGFPGAKEKLTEAYLRRAFSNVSVKADNLKTKSGKVNCIDTFLASMHKFEYLLSTENRSLFNALESDLRSQFEAPDNLDNDFTPKYALPSAQMQKFYSLSEQISTNKEIEKKLQACEASYAILAQVIMEFIRNDHELPPVITCRDTGPELYMRLGKWDRAAQAIKVCMDADAYYPNTTEEGENELQYLREYMDVANAAVAFIKDNPGTLQKDIYKNLQDLDRDILKSFTRSSMQIRKVKHGNTNELYIV